MSDSIVKWYGHGERPKYPWEQNGGGSGGGNGAAGKDGKAATVRVGSVSSGQIASVTNTGTETDAVLNFTLPKGERGERGENGTKGDKGDNGKSAYELAKDGGFARSQEEWLKSLKGKDGRDVQSGGGGGWFPKIVKLTRAEVAEMNGLVPVNGVYQVGNNVLYKVKYEKTYDRPPIPFVTPNSTGNMVFYNRSNDVDGFYFSLSYGTYFDGLSYFLVEDNEML